MAKRIFYECNICKQVCHPSRINNYKRRWFSTFGSIRNKDNFYICDSCLERIRKEIKGEE